MSRADETNEPEEDRDGVNTAAGAMATTLTPVGIDLGDPVRILEVDPISDPVPTPFELPAELPVEQPEYEEVEP